MKYKVSILLFLFSLVQFGPVIKSLIFEGQSIVFVIDEEKNSGESEKSNDDCKDLKEFTRQILALRFINNSSLFILHRNERLILSPVFDILSPPPDRV